MKNIKIPKIQHYVPRFILKQFCEKNDQIWVFDKHKGIKFKTNIKNIAAENGFYDFEISGQKATLELSISEIEGQASEVLRKIVKNKKLSVIDDNEKNFLSHFFSLQFVRTKQWRHMWGGLNNEIMRAFFKKDSGSEDIEEIKESDDEDTKLQHMQSIQDSDEFAPAFLNKTWVLLESTKRNGFWISDNPISFQNNNKFGPYGNIGLNVTGIEIYVPLSKNLSLGLWCPSIKENFKKAISQYKILSSVAPEMLPKIIPNPKSIEGIIEGMDKGVPISSTMDNIINYNSLQVSFASRFVFSNNNDFSLAEKMIKTDPDLIHGPKIKAI